MWALFVLWSHSISLSIGAYILPIVHDVKKMYLHVSPDLQLGLLATLYPLKILHKIGSGVLGNR